MQVDSRHAELPVQQCGFDSKTKGIVTPGVKHVLVEEGQEPLGPEEAVRYKSLRMRLGYLSLDRPDVQLGWGTPTPRTTTCNESEYYEHVRVASRATGARNRCVDLGFELWSYALLQVCTDSAATEGVASRRGVGSIRHLETGNLWVHTSLHSGRFALVEVDGKSDIADLTMKRVERCVLASHLSSLSLRISWARAALAPK